MLVINVLGPHLSKGLRSVGRKRQPQNNGVRKSEDTVGLLGDIPGSTFKKEH